jgi:NDP-sugar pyrophosphorylase family protein
MMGAMGPFSPSEFFSLAGFSHREVWQEDDAVWDALRHLEGYLGSLPLGKKEIPIPPGVYLERPEAISIGAGTILEPGVYIKGPCVIGAGCIIRHGAYLRERVILGEKCVVGHSAELKHAIVLPQSSVTHFVYLGDSIVGRRVNLGAGVKCANLRMDLQEVGFLYGGRRIKTGLKKMGAILGDGVQVGCNAVLNPGTLAGPDAKIYPLVSARGWIAARATVTGKKAESRVEA